MNALIKFLNSLIDLIVANPGMTKAQVVDELQLATNGITNAVGAQWFDDLAVVYEKIGVINVATFSAWRNEIQNEGAVSPKALVEHIAATLVVLPELDDVNSALRFKRLEDRVAEIQIDINAVKVFRDAQADPVIVQALNFGLQTMRQQRDDAARRIQ